ncbi:winged helix-turn-helix domain-containing protein [Sinorhizobium meliloti]|uniref:winged helix-turn-helix domain-containing protein n=1 Tax=Rhizobium meliloti TaxID=382 RepID=UPI000FD6ED2D|nr:winged helix-turn-helix domain-containing protein [Sinorhizobium meliloti]MDW9622912.1 hypothetical protein [Sinorhizobium meliloti]MDW9993625.1 hypothetical protein [Sinorhizobium meliloti]RVG01720.1 ArsR family transcriptional regulator [Sinorhizobium meliloti]RVH46472.1 ArsR family transcriptional regulator [Sinorhizobium meliloti]RVI51522.1 ArsR family transcriptional regulator [Sinorhizobium meliloti]
MTSYREWLEGHKEASQARGGRPIRPPSRTDEGYFLRAKAEGWDHIRGYRGWKSGEIVNPITGEIVTNCLTVAKLSTEIDMTSHKLIDLMETLGLLHRVLAWRNVPMICVPGHLKPQYYHKPEATRWAIEEGYCIPITVDRAVGFEQKRFEMILITPEGQKLIAAKVAPPKERKAKVSQIVSHLLRAGRSQAEIAKLTGYSQQVVSYHAKKLQMAA